MTGGEAITDPESSDPVPDLELPGAALRTTQAVAIACREKDHLIQDGSAP